MIPTTIMWLQRTVPTPSNATGRKYGVVELRVSAPVFSTDNMRLRLPPEQSVNKSIGGFRDQPEEQRRRAASA
jgi:hypothetical protein